MKISNYMSQIGKDMSELVVSTGNMADPTLLGKIDKLFASGVGEYISLPQLIVVGDQSSGKSSVLEGLTSLPFPRDQGLCTRFATQIKFCRANNKEILLSILPAPGSSEDHADACRKWASSKPEFTASLFASAMKEAREVMNIESGNTFSEDVLCIEIRGPDEEHFSVVDIPGIFRATTSGVTTEADKAMVYDMVNRYMNNPRSIILATVPANTDVATQEILTLAKKADGDGHRTIGILTKPDLVDEGTQSNVAALVEGKRHQLALGWCIVRNPGQAQLDNTPAERRAIESSFFKTKAPWNALDKNRVGIEALRLRLQEILNSTIRREFPKVRMEILKRLQTCRKSLEALGQNRSTPDEQRRYLQGISSQFQDLVRSALSTDYNSNDWFSSHKILRFATEIVSRNDILAETLDKHGHLYAFNHSAEEQHEESSDGEEIEDYDDNQEGSDSGSAKKAIIRHHPDPDMLTHKFSAGHGIELMPKPNVLAWLTKIYEESRGFELGTFEGSVLATTMKFQSAKWEPIAIGYIQDVTAMAHDFIWTMLSLVCPDEQVRDALLSVLMDDLQAKYDDASSFVKFLLQVERAGTPATVNHYFTDNLEKSRQDRLRSVLEKKQLVDCKHGAVVRLDDVFRVRSKSNIQHVVQEIHDILRAYYKVARKRFVDNLCMQGADYHLVTGPASPLKLFSPTFVSHLSEEQLHNIAGEDPMLQRKRAALKKEIADLEIGKKVVSS